MDPEPDYDSMRSLIQIMKGLTFIHARNSALIAIVRLLKEENDPHASPIRLLEEREVVLASCRQEVRIPIGIEERAIAIEGLIKAWNLCIGP
jgi:hypothetical protein